MEILSLLVPLLLIYALGKWILGPIDQAAKLRNAPVRFSIADFLCLFVVIQIPLAGVHQLASDIDPRIFWTLTIGTWIVAPLIWLFCTHALSKAGIVRGWHRMVFCGVIVPIAYYGIIPFVGLTGAGIAAIFTAERDDSVSYLWLFSIWLALAIALVASGLYTRWIVKQAEKTAIIEPPTT